MNGHIKTETVDFLDCPQPTSFDVTLSRPDGEAYFVIVVSFSGTGGILSLERRTKSIMDINETATNAMKALTGIIPDDWIYKPKDDLYF